MKNNQSGQDHSVLLLCDHVFMIKISVKSMAVFVIDKLHVCKIPNNTCIVILIMRFIRKFLLKIRF